MEDELIGKLSRKRSRSVSIESNSVESESQDSVTDYFPASKLFEYQWPLGDEGADHYLLQEHVKEYLDIRSIQRKYPDLTRRVLEFDERRYLVGRGVVTEIQSNMGLVALRSEEVMELMAEDYSQKYREYIAVVQEREFQAALRRKKQESKRLALLAESQNLDSSSSEILTQSVQLAVEYNAQLAEQRRTVRNIYHDTQTNITQVPRRPPVVRELSPTSYYPVALVPGQYSDHCKRYSPEELRRMPLNTAMELPKAAPTPAQSTTGTPPPPSSSSSHPLPLSLSTLSTGSHLSTTTTKALLELFNALAKASPSSDNSKPSTPPTATPTTTPTSTRNISKQALLSKPVQLSVGKPVVCNICFKGHGSNKQGQPEELLQCSTCSNSIHPSCYNLSEVSLRVLKSYAWQCLDCKICQVCSDPNNEDKMVCCDECDRGYHSFCVGLSDIPEGRWVCSKCCSCASCGSDSPGKETTATWQHESAKDKSLRTLCVKCSGFFRLGYYCPVCYKVYYNDDTDSPMVCCDVCDKWIHIECDNITEEQYKELSKDESKAKYTCPLCRADATKKE